MDKEEVIRAFCSLNRLVFDFVPHSAGWASDGFCDQCDEHNKGMSYANDGRVIGFIRDAITERLSRHFGIPYDEMIGFLKENEAITGVNLVDLPGLDGKSRWKEEI